MNHVVVFCVDLDVQGNVLTSLSDAVGDMEHLISINLSKNRLTVFPERLTHVKSLENISVEGNQITGDMSRNHNSILHTLNIPSPSCCETSKISLFIVLRTFKMLLL